MTNADLAHCDPAAFGGSQANAANPNLSGTITINATRDTA
jgi:hypothetical protein